MIKQMKNKRIKNYFFNIATFGILTLPSMVLAQNTGLPASGNCADGHICNPIGIDSLPNLIKTILEAVIKIGIPVSALAIVYCGFLFVSARGNSEKLKTAKNALTYTLIGTAILLGSWAIAKLISSTVLSL